MPFYVSIARCHRGHELTVVAEPISETEIHLTCWGCEECAREAIGEPEASELRGDKAMGLGRGVEKDMVSAADDCPCPVCEARRVKIEAQRR